MGHADKEPKRLCRIFCKRFAYRYEVLQALAHLLPLYAEHARVQPVLYERLNPEGGLCLRDLVGMVREDELACASVYVVLRAEERVGYRSVFYVPAWPAGELDLFAIALHLYLPRRLSGLARLPQGEIVHVLLALLRLYPVLLEFVYLHP